MGGFGTAVLEAASEAGSDTSHMHRPPRRPRSSLSSTAAGPELLPDLGLDSRRHCAGVPKMDRSLPAKPQAGSRVTT